MKMTAGQPADMRSSGSRSCIYGQGPHPRQGALSTTNVAPLQRANIGQTCGTAPDSLGPPAVEKSCGAALIRGRHASVQSPKGQLEGHLGYRVGAELPFLRTSRATRVCPIRTRFQSTYAAECSHSNTQRRQRGHFARHKVEG